MKSVSITGATGLVGRHLVPLLIKNGYDIRALVRKNSPGRASLPSAVNIIEGDVWRYGEIPVEFTKGADIAISLAGILYDRSGARVEDVNVRGVENFVSACRKGGVHRIIHLSVIGASANGCSRYFRSKWQGEEIVRNSGMAYTIFRPSIIYGAGSEFIKRMLEVASTPIVIPVPAHGQNLSCPVYAGDMADAILNSIERRDCINQTIDACGPDALSTDELVTTVHQCATGKKKAVFHIPPGILKPLAMIEEKVSSNPKITSDLLKMMTVDTTGNHTVFQRIVGHTLTSYKSWCLANLKPNV